MKRGVALLTVIGLVIGSTVPVFAEEQISTYKGDQELVLSEAGDVDIIPELIL